MIARPVRQVLHQAHSIVGLVMSLVLACLGVTGVLMSFEDEIGDWLNKDIMHVSARDSAMLTPDEIIRRVEADNAPARVSGITLNSDPSLAARARFAREESGPRRLSVYVDPYDGRTLGTPQGEEAFATIRRLHRWLLLPGDGNGYGRWITGAAVLCLLVLLCSGIVLRWPRRVRSFKTWLKPNTALRGRGLYWTLHSVVGTWLLPVYLVTVLTGLWWSYDWYRAGATWLLGGSPPATTAQKATVKAGLPEAPKGAKAQRAASGERSTVSVDGAWSAFLARFGSTYATATFLLPQGGGSMIRVRSVPKDAPGETARDEIRIDAASGRIVNADIYAEKTAGQAILARVLDIHRGHVFGLAGRLIFMLAAALMPFFLVTGYLLYFSRRRLHAAVKDHAHAPASPARPPGEPAQGSLS